MTCGVKRMVLQVAGRVGKGSVAPQCCPSMLPLNPIIASRYLCTLGTGGGERAGRFAADSRESSM